MTRQPTILIADDDDHARLLLRTVLEHSGCDVFEAKNGIEALESIGVVRADLIILDVGMPDIDGYRLVRRLRRQKGLRSIPILALTAFAFEKDRVAAARAGFTDWLSKPVNLPTLRAKVQELLGSPVAA